MLKKISKLFLGLVVCASSACVTPTHASSAFADPQSDLLITKIQAASSVSAKDELIEIYNPSQTDIDVSGWCFTNKALVKFACFEAKSEESVILRPMIPSGGYITVASTDYVTHNPSLSVNSSVYTFISSNYSSGSLVASSDMLQLTNGDTVVDSWSWQVATPTGKLLTRHIDQQDPLVYATTGTATDWQLVAQGESLRSSLYWIEFDAPNTPNLPNDVPLPLEITELLPNAVGVDTNNEFVEIYNPNKVAVTSDGYDLLVGEKLDKTYALPADFTLPPESHSVLKSDTIKYSLNNTKGGVQLRFNENLVGEPIAYENAPEGQSWADVEGEWQYTNRPTPGLPNLASQADNTADEEESVVAAVQKPCAANQYRSGDTGRCRLIATATAAPAQCKEGQTRNAATGRCRNNIVADSPAPCKIGQERNAETSRCRNVTKMTNASNKLKVNEKTQPSNAPAWYMWIGIGGIVMAIVSYAVWEWRAELRVLLQKVRKWMLKRHE